MGGCLTNDNLKKSQKLEIITEWKQGDPVVNDETSVSGKKKKNLKASSRIK